MWQDLVNWLLEFLGWHVGEKSGLLKPAQETSQWEVTEQFKDRDCDESGAGQQPPKSLTRGSESLCSGLPPILKGYENFT